MSKKILVTGANGNIGSKLVKVLADKNVEVRLAVRDLEKAKQIFGTAKEVVEFDFDRPQTYDAATNGIDAVFLLGPTLSEKLHETTAPFIEHLGKKGIKKVVYLAAFGFEKVKELPFHEITAKKLADEGFDYTILKPAFFAQNFKNFEWDNITARGITYAPAGEGKVGFIDTEDIARVAAEVLTSDRYGKKVLELTGPELLTHFEVAELLTQVTGKKVVYPNPSSAEYKATLEAAGAPAFVGDFMDKVYSAIRNGHVNRTTNTIKEVTGREPATLKNVLERDFAGVKA